LLPKSFNAAILFSAGVMLLVVFAGSQVGLAEKNVLIVDKNTEAEVLFPILFFPLFQSRFTARSMKVL